VKTSGAAPVPPSPPSIVMKSGARPLVAHLPRQLVPEAHLADRALDADRQAGGVGEALDEVEHRRHVGERGVRGRAVDVLAHRHAADAGDLGGDLGGGQEAAHAGLGALAELELDRAHRRRRHGREEASPCEAAARVAAAEVAGADLPDQVAARAVEVGDAALAGVLQRAGERHARLSASTAAPDSEP
jgi:hypothetical protein